MSLRILSFILVIVVLIVTGRTVVRAVRRSKKWPIQRQAILRLFEQKQEIANDDVEQALQTSDTNATRLLERLEKEHFIDQHGSTGRGVVYTLKK